MITYINSSFILNNSDHLLNIKSMLNMVVAMLFMMQGGFAVLFYLQHLG